MLLDLYSRLEFKWAKELPELYDVILGIVYYIIGIIIAFLDIILLPIELIIWFIKRRNKGE